MKQQIVNPKIAVLTFAVMVFAYGIVDLGSADGIVDPHFHEASTIRSVPANAAVGTNVGAPVSAHGLEGLIIYRYTLGGVDIAYFNLDHQTGQLTIRTALGEVGASYSVTVNVEVEVLEDVENYASITYLSVDSIDVTIEVTSTTGVAAADALPGVSSEERSRIAGALAMDRVIFNELHNATTDTHDWIELRNITNADLTLNGWEVRIVTGETTDSVTLPSGTVLPAGGLLLLVNTDPDAPEMPLSMPEEAAYLYVVDEGLILPASNFTLLLRSATSWEDSVGNFFFGHEIPPTAPSLTTDTAWYRARPDALGYQAEAWVMSGYQDGTGYDLGVPAASALGTPGYSHTSLTEDVNRDGTVNILDLVFVASHFDAVDASAADVNGDGTVNILDLVMVSNAFGRVMDTQ